MFVADTIEPRGKPGQQEMHSAGKVSTGSPQHKMKMIGHNRICEDVPAGSQGYLLDGGQERIARPWVIEDRLAVIPARVDMENRVRAFLSGSSSHTLDNRWRQGDPQTSPLPEQTTPT